MPLLPLANNNSGGHGVLLDAMGRRLMGSDGKVMLGTPSGNCTCLHRQAKKCSDNSDVDLWLLVADLPETLTISKGGVCYHFNEGNNESCNPGTIAADYTLVASCASCSSITCSGDPPGGCSTSCSCTASTSYLVCIATSAAAPCSALNNNDPGWTLTGSAGIYTYEDGNVKMELTLTNTTACFQTYTLKGWTKSGGLTLQFTNTGTLGECAKQFNQSLCGGSSLHTTIKIRPKDWWSPETWTAIFQGVTAVAGCQAHPSNGSWYTTLQVPDGSYILPKLTSCIWRLNIDEVWRKRWNNSSCSSLANDGDGVRLTFSLFSGMSVKDIRDAFSFFETGTLSGCRNCRQSITLSNIAPVTTFSYSTGGSVMLIPNP